ncbi:MAG: ABC transporter permease [Deltaproteobacteria bacterium]|nr:ABC transporter permease [Deltaproteobacteria bacterium]
MNTLDHVVAAFGALRANPVRGFLTTLGVIIGVLSIILLVGLGDGVRTYLAEAFSGLGSSLIEVIPGKTERKGMGPPPLNNPRKITLEDARAIERRARTLDAVSPIVFGGGTLRYLDRRRDVAVFGTSAMYPDMRNLHVQSGRFFDDEDALAGRHVVVVGTTIVRELFGEENPLGRTVKITDVPFRIVGVMAPKGQTFGFDWDDIAYVPAQTAMDLFQLDGVTQVLCRSRDRRSTAAAMDDIREVLSARHNFQEDFTIRSQDDLLETVNDLLRTMTLVILAIASISLVVGGIGIMNIMLVSVKERTREIGIRRAVGATRTDILLQFLVEAVVISLVGGLVGLGLGAGIIAIARNVVPDLPVELSAWIVAVAMGFSALVGVLSGVLPARNAALVDPVEALRYE